MFSAQTGQNSLLLSNSVLQTGHVRLSVVSTARPTPFRFLCQPTLPDVILDWLTWEYQNLGTICPVRQVDPFSPCFNPSAPTLPAAVRSGDLCEAARTNS